ncbi:hypothetical protein [Nonomuraea rubra]|jgi:hypothetical protein|uniref:Uncharacterized protein n=1 Tax=Nonomuraea rubra TaxID=46180 RepID=A0A7X0U5P5_9ACTN|nr:hypothetical protein [Nonomuraea rubra]MBB6556126.1 hypothetical protein [Nonomuraea rubra]
MSDGLWLRWWHTLYPSLLPRHPEPAENEPGDGRIPSLIDEAN